MKRASRHYAGALARDLLKDGQQRGELVAGPGHIRCLCGPNSYVGAIALTHLGLVLQRTGDHDNAAASLQQALELFRSPGHRPGQAWTLNNLGLVQQETTDYGAASASHQQALELFRDTGDQLGQATALNHLGQLASRTANHRRARHHYTQALAMPSCGSRRSACGTPAGSGPPGRGL